METEKLYSPLNFYLRDFGSAEDGVYDEKDYWRDEITHAEAFGYMANIKAFLADDRKDFDTGRGLAEYLTGALNSKVQSLVPAIELHGDSLWMVAELQLNEPLDSAEMADLKEWWEGQLSDGWGESLEQHEVKLKHGDLYIEPWTADDSFSIATQQEFDRRMGRTTSLCRNGELRSGDMVLSAPDGDYSCLVGTVLSINKVGTPEHAAETGNMGDSIHVDFIKADYSANRRNEIEQMLGDLYGRPTTPGILPPIDVEDVIMEPDMLYRITGIGRDELEAILDSGENAAAYAQKLEAELHETPAQAALHEPDIYDDDATAALREQLIQRLNGNLHEYFDSLAADTVHDIANMTPEIAAVAGAHYYLTEIHNFHTSELEYLMRFQNPLSVVADKFEISGMDDHSDIMWDIFDRQDALQGDYPLMPDPASDDARKQELFQRLDSNLSEYREGLMSAEKADIINMAGEIAARYEVRDYLKNSYEFQPGEVDYLLQFKHPLAVVSKGWPETVDDLVDMRDVVRDILGEKTGHGDFLKVDAPVESPAPERLPEKLSVMERIRQARADAKDNPTPRRDAPGNDHGPEL